jgi:hypothetical protein
VGVYEATVSTKTSDQPVSSIALGIASQIKASSSVDPLIVEFETSSQNREVDGSI